MLGRNAKKQRTAFFRHMDFRVHLGRNEIALTASDVLYFKEMTFHLAFHTWHLKEPELTFPR